MTTISTAHRVVSREAWIAERKKLLAKEKELTRLGDELSAARRDLPWVKVDKTYAFDTTTGKKTLGELFDGRSQLIVYHFMWLWEDGQGCPGCSFITDHMDGANFHLSHHDVTLLAVSRGKLADIQAYKKRMGWKVEFVSSFGSDFNFDYHVSFHKGAEGQDYNYAPTNGGSEELPGLSVFYKDAAGDIFHTYSSYARGGDILIGTNNYLDLTPKGRNETQIMDWMRRHDEYADAKSMDDCCHS